MDATSEDSIDSNYSFQNIDCYDCLCRLSTSNQGSSKFIWRPNIWHCVSICSVIVSVACLVTLVCMTTGNSEQRTTSFQEINNGLTTELHKLNKSIHQNQKHIAAIRKRLEHSCLVPLPNHVKNPDKNKTKRVRLECGGLIPLPPAGDSILLDYKSQESYKKNEKCLWILDSATENETKCYAKIKITVQCEGFGDEDDDGLFVFDWVDWEHLTSFELSRNKDYNPSNSSGWQFLSFTSTNNSESVGGTGFILRLDVLEKSSYHFGTNIALTETLGTVTYGPSMVRDRIGVVVNPPLTSFTLILDYLESQGNKEGECQEHDSLHIFTVGRSGSSAKLPLLCGTLKKRSYVFQDPVLVAFLTLRSPTGQGFRLSWMGAE